MLPRKPADCRCAYPRVTYEDITGHAVDCPAYHRIRATLTIHRDPPDNGKRFVPVDSPQLRLHP